MEGDGGALIEKIYNEGDQGDEVDEDNDKLDPISTNEEYGGLYVGHVQFGDWINKVNILLSQLYYSFIDPTEELKNGIKIFNNESKIPKQFKENKKYYLIGDIVSSFLLSSYIIKLISYNIGSSGSMSQLSPVNIVLYSIDDCGKCGLKTLRSIETILNHPHFNGCKSPQQIQEKIPIIQHILKMIFLVE